MQNRSSENWIKPENPVYVLCAGRELPGGDYAWPLQASPYPWSGPFEAEPDAEGFHGLLWGAGDWSLGGLRWSTYWAVVRVSAYVEVTSDDRRAVLFERGEVVFHGDRPDALKTLIDLGADPSAFAFEVRSVAKGATVDVGDCGVARASDAGTARAGQFGWAQSGRYGISVAGSAGFARAGTWGIAVADEQGRAEAGDYGIAVSDGKRYGTAKAGMNGVAMGRENHKIAEAGQWGIAIVAALGSAMAGPRGTAIGHFARASAGRGGIAIGIVVSGDLGSLLVARSLTLKIEKLEYAMGIVGENGVEPFVRYRCAGGVLKPVEPW
jgi:hypothetical protein